MHAGQCGHRPHIHNTVAYLEAVDAGLLFALSQLLPVWLLPAAWLAVRKRLWPAEGMGGTLPVQSASTTSASSLGRMICPPYVTKWHSLAALHQDTPGQFAFARVVLRRASIMHCTQCRLIPYCSTASLIGFLLCIVIHDMVEGSTSCWRSAAQLEGQQQHRAFLAQNQ